MKTYYVRINPPEGGKLGVREVIGDAQPMDGEELKTEAELRTLESELALEVPQSVTDLQLRKALSAVGLRGAVEAAIAAGDQNLKDDWERRLVFHRDHPLLREKAIALGMTEPQVDDLFRLAESFP